MKLFSKFDLSENWGLLILGSQKIEIQFLQKFFKSRRTHYEMWINVLRNDKNLWLHEWFSQKLQNLVKSGSSFLKCAELFWESTFENFSKFCRSWKKSFVPTFRTDQIAFENFFKVFFFSVMYPLLNVFFLCILCIILQYFNATHMEWYLRNWWH